MLYGLHWVLLILIVKEAEYLIHQGWVSPLPVSYSQQTEWNGQMTGRRKTGWEAGREGEERERCFVTLGQWRGSDEYETRREGRWVRKKRSQKKPKPQPQPSNPDSGPYTVSIGIAWALCASALEVFTYSTKCRSPMVWERSEPNTQSLWYTWSIKICFWHVLHA